MLRSFQATASGPAPGDSRRDRGRFGTEHHEPDRTPQLRDGPSLCARCVPIPRERRRSDRALKRASRLHSGDVFNPAQSPGRTARLGPHVGNAFAAGMRSACNGVENRLSLGISGVDKFPRHGNSDIHLFEPHQSVGYEYYSGIRKTLWRSPIAELKEASDYFCPRCWSEMTLARYAEWP
jgi:hypothetical protein